MATDSLDSIRSAAEQKITDSVLISSILGYLNEPEDTKVQIKILDKVFKLATRPGDNYVSQVYQVGVKYKIDDDDAEYSTQFIIKCIQDDEIFASLVKESQVFEKEQLMYEKVIPALETLSGITLAPKCYHVQQDGCKLMVFSDMKEMGYKMGDRVKGLDFEHCKLVVERLAVFHASSIVFVEEGNKELMINFSKGMSTDTILVEYVFKSHLMTLIQVVDKWIEPEFDGMADVLKNILTNYWTVYKMPMITESDDIRVLNHGDAWCNNFMFTYEEDGTASDVILLDHQMPFYTSPGYDLHYFLITTPDMDTRLNRERDLLRIYRNKFNEKLDEMGFNQMRLTEEQLQNSYQKKSIYGFTMMLTILPLIMRTVPEQCEASEDKEVVMREMLTALFANEDFITILKHSLRKFQKLGTFECLKDL